MADPTIRLKRSSTPGKIPLVTDLQLGELAVNINDGKAFLKKDVSGSETIVTLGGGYPGQTYYVTKTGLDTNDGQDITSAFASLKHALSVATVGDTIEISSGVFTEIFPLTIPQGVTVRGYGLRSTFIQPTLATERNDAFLLNGETTIEDISLGNFYYDSSTDTGYGFRFTPNMVTTTRSPYVQRVTVLNKGSNITANDPYGFDTLDNYPTEKIAGRGALIDASVVQSTTLEPSILFNECTFIIPNQTALKMINGARTEWVNCFTYFASVGIDGVSGNVGVASTANAQIKLSGITTDAIGQNYVIKYYQSGLPVAIGTVVSTDNDYVTILGKGSGLFNSVGIGSTQDVRIFQSDGTTQVGTATTILWADYQKFGADMRSIGSATNFGTVGVRGDGKGVQLRLFGFNFGCVGSGKTFTQDPTLTIKSNEVIQTNGGRVYYQSVDQAGNFNVGTLLQISQEEGLVSIGTTSDINVTGTLSLNRLETAGISTFRAQIDHFSNVFNTNQGVYNLINDNATEVNFAGDATDLSIGAETGVTTVRNYTVNLSGGQESYSPTTGTLQVDGGVGISSNLNVGKDLKISGVSTFINSVRVEDELRVSGVSTFVSDTEFNNNIRTSGIGTINNLNVTGFSTFNNSSEFDNDVLVSGITTLTTMRVTGISTLMGNVELNNALRVAGVSTFNSNSMINAHLNVSGITTTGNFRVTGVSTLTGDTNLTNNLNVLGITTTGNFRVTGVSTLTGNTNFTNNVNVSGITTTATFRVTGISTLMGNVELNNALRVAGVSTFNSNSMINAHLNVTGITTTGNFRVTGVSTLTGDTNFSNNVNVLGITTTGNFRVTGVSTLTGDTNFTNNVNVSGITTTATFRVTGISTLMGNVELNNALRVAGVSTFNSNSMINANLNVTGITTTGNFRVTGVSTLTGDTNLTNNLNVSGIITTATFRVTGISTLMGDVRLDNNLNVTGISTLIGDVRLDNNLNVTGISTFNNTISHNSQLFITNQSTYSFIDTTTTTVTAFGDATNIGIGSTNATLTLRPSTIVGTNLSQNVYNTVASTVNAFGAATSLNIGEASGTTTLRSITLVGSNATQNLYNTVATSVNAFGAATGIVLGATSGIATIRNTTVSLPNATTFNINGANPTISGSSTGTLSLFNTNITRVNAFGAATGIVLGATSGIATIRNTTVSLPNATTFNINGANPTIAASSTGLLSLFNTNITRVNAFGDATNIVIGSATTTGVTTIRTSIISPNGFEGSGVIVGIVTVYDSNFGIDAQSSGTSTFNNLDVVGVASIFGNLDVFGSTNLSNINSNGTFTTQNFEVLGISTFSRNVEIQGDLTVNGNVTTVNSVTISIDDKNIELGAASGNVGLAATLTSGEIFINLDENGFNTTVGIIPGMEIFVTSGVGTVATGAKVVSTTLYSIEVDSPHPTDGEIIFDVGGPSEFTADGGGITLLASGDFSNNKTWDWKRSTNAWSTPQNINVESSNSSYLIAGSSVLDFNTVKTPNAYHAGVVTTFNLDVSSGFSTIFDLETGYFKNNFGLYAVGVSSLNETYIASGIVTGLSVDYFTLTNKRVLITTQLNTVIGPSTNKIAIDTTGLAPEMRVYSSGTELLSNTTILSIDEPGIITITPLSVNSTLATTSTLTIYDDPQAGVASISVLKADVGIVTNFDTLNANVTGITTLQRLYVNTDIYTPGISSANTITARVGLITFVSGTNITYSGIGTINNFYSNIGFVTNIMGNNIQYTGISTLPNLITNVGFITYLSGTNIEYIGVSTLPNLITNVGFITTIYGTDLQLTGVTTVPTIVTNTGFVTTISGTRATYTDIDNTYFYNVGIASLTDVFANTGIVTTISGTDLNYSGIGTINDFYANFVYSGIGTIGTLDSTTVTISNTLDVLSFIADIGTITLLDVDFLKVAGILTVPVINNEVISISTATVTSIGATTIDVEELLFDQASSSGILTVTNLNATLGIITSYIGQDLTVGVATVPIIENTVLNTSGIGTIENLFTNVGVVTTLASDYILSTNYIIGIGTSSVTIGVTTTIIGISTAEIQIGDVISGPIGIETGTTVVGFGNTDEIIISPASTNIGTPIVGIITYSRDNQAGVASITTLKTNVGLVTNISGTNLYYTGIATVNNLYTNVGFVTFISGNNLLYSGISTLGVVEANTLQINNITNTDTVRTNVGLITHLSGTNIKYTGISTLSNLITNVGFITYITGQNLKITGVTTSTIIRSEDINVSGITTTNYLRVGAAGTVLIADASAGIGSVGINTSSPNAALHLYGDMQFNGNVLVGTISTTLTSNAEQTVQTLSSVDFRSVEYTVQVSTGSTHQIAKILSIHDEVTAYNSEYSNITTGVEIASFDVIVDNTIPPGYIGLRVTPVSNVDPTIVTVNFSAIRA